MTDIVFYNATTAHITRTSGVAGGQPCIAGRRVRVQDVYVWHEHLGMSADEIASAYDLSLVQVYAALTYAFESLEAIQQALRDSDALVDALKARYPSKLRP